MSTAGSRLGDEPTDEQTFSVPSWCVLTDDPREISSRGGPTLSSPLWRSGEDERDRDRGDGRGRTVSTGVQNKSGVEEEEEEEEPTDGESFEFEDGSEFQRCRIGELPGEEIIAETG